MLDKTFDPKSIEKDIAKQWESLKIGRPTSEGSPYCIMVPPPNVTGSLHLGHALQHSIMDTLCRYKRSTGYQVLLQVGTDHAGIATQMVVEQQLKKKDISRYDLGREGLIEKIWEWKEHSGNTIKNQMKRMGLSVDWETERFTLDKDFNKAVLNTFVTLYKQGYIYRGKRLVNWDTALKTAVSDLEVQSVSKQGSIWHIKYPLENGQHIIVATTRPETLLGDMAICVHPEDDRYKDLVGKQAIIPICGRKIPIIADEEVDPEFGTGCLKITPAHDFTDFEIGKKHGLEALNILTPEGQMNDICPEPYQGLDRFVARKQIVQELKSLKLLEAIEPHTSVLPIGDRSQTILEPYLTDQWYVNMNELAKAALEDLHSENLTFTPSHFGKEYEKWLNNIEDWCISRQLWWGHRIPAFYDEAGNVYVGEDEATIRKENNIEGPLTQDEDVLDTWFSSALWPFATLGWPENTQRLKTFYPNNLLITGFDIIFFWVARMTMMGKHFTKTMPFPNVYVTGLIRDESGQKMSKSKGNVLDPLDLIEGASLDHLVDKRTQGMMLNSIRDKVIQATKTSFPQGIEAHGTDALRFTLLALSTHSKDINFDLNKLRAHRNFCNKIWNAARFLSQSKSTMVLEDTLNKALAYQINLLIDEINKHLNDYRFDLYAKALYDFFWHEFCDWHLELAKVNSNYSSDERMGHLYQVFEDILILLHPALPFITEALWQAKHNESITLQSMPQKFHNDEKAYKSFLALKNLIGGIRNIRSELNINPKEKLDLYYSLDETQLLKDYEAEIKQLTNIANIYTSEEIPNHCCIFLDQGIEIGINIKGKIEPQIELTRLKKKLNKIKQQYDKLQKKVSNPNYLKKAPSDLKKSDTALLVDVENDIKRLEEHLIIIQRL